MLIQLVKILNMISHNTNNEVYSDEMQMCIPTHNDNIEAPSQTIRFRMMKATVI